MKLKTERSRYKGYMDWENMVIVVKEHDFLFFYTKVWEMSVDEIECYTKQDQELNFHLAVAQYECHMRNRALKNNEVES